MEIFKIRNKEGLYWKGIVTAQNYPEFYDKFDDEGKFWIDLHILNFELNRLEDRTNKINKKLYLLPEYLKDCEIVKFETIEKEIIKIN